MQRRLYWLLCLSCWASAGLWAQQQHYSWKIGIHGGISQYYGDLSGRVLDLPLHFQESPTQNFEYISYGLSVEHHWTRALGIRLLGTKNQFRASDRRHADASNYERALNVQTDVWDLSVLGIWYTDTDRLFGRHALVSPYVLFGLGASYFTPRGDLLNGNGERYYYWTDNSIRTLDQNDPNAGMATLLERDYVYETALAPLQTEGQAYDPITWNAVLGLGVKWRLSHRFTLHLEGLVRYTGTDYLDDVANTYGSPTSSFQAYAANPSGSNRSQRGNTPELNDWYAQGLLSLHYSFGQKTYPIQPSIIYTLDNTAPTLVSPTPGEEPPLPPVTPPPAPKRIKTTDTVRTTVTTTTTIITTTTVDSVNHKTRSTKIRPPIQSEGPSINERMPIELVDTILHQNMVLDIDEATLDSLFDLSYKAANPSPIDAVDHPTSETISPLGDTTSELPTSPTTVVETANRWSPTTTSATNQQDSIVGYYEMALARERYKNDLRTTQLRAEYERQLQAKEQELYQLRLNDTAVKATSRLPQTAATRTPSTPVPPKEQAQQREADRQALEERLDALQDQIAQLRQTPTPDNGTLTNQNAELQRLNKQLAAQQTELRRLRQAQQQDSTQALVRALEVQQQELAQLRQTLAAQPATSDPEQSQLLQQLQDQQQELENLRVALLHRPTPNTDPERSAELETLRQRLVKQDQELVQLRQSAKNSPTVITQVVTPDDYDPNELDRLRAEEQRLRTRLDALEQGATLQVDTVRVVQDRMDSQQAATIARLNRELEAVRTEHRLLTGTLQEFLTRKKPTHITKIYFDLGRSSLTPQAKETLTTLTEYLQNYPEVRFTVKGFASKTGNATINQRLSTERAAEVAAYLNQLGIAQVRITHTGMGELERPIAHELDRRAEVHLGF